MKRKRKQQWVLAIGLLVASALSVLVALSAGQIVAAVSPVPTPLNVEARQAELDRLRQEIIGQEKAWRESRSSRASPRDSTGLISPDYAPEFRAGGRSMDELVSEEWALRGEAERAALTHETTLRIRDGATTEVRIAAWVTGIALLLMACIALVWEPSPREKERSYDGRSEPARAVAEALGRSVGRIEGEGKVLITAFNKGRSTVQQGGRKSP